MWGEADSDLHVEALPLSTPPAVPPFAAVAARLADTPELRTFAHEARLREARVQLARSAAVADVSWEVGVRRLQETADVGLIGSVSIPLGSAGRAAPGVASAQAELAALDFEREGQERQLEATLAEVHGRLETSVLEVVQLTEELLPRLRAAEAASADAYARGALSYLEWAQLQADTLAAERERLAAGVEAYRALIELQRLTGDAFSTDATPTQESTP
jgi:cobalt-zinc-cadmium efflux system outer membrane protein